MATSAPRQTIFTALLAAQKAISSAHKGSVNPHFRSKYADFATVVEAVKPQLNAVGIVYFFEAGISDTGHQTLTTVLCHADSGSEVRCVVPLTMVKQDMQGYKSATTYAKRIGLESLTGIPTDDDDGEAATRRPQQQRQQPEEPQYPSAAAMAHAIKEAIQRVGREAAETAFHGLGYKNSADVPASARQAVLDVMRGLGDRQDARDSIRQDVIRVRGDAPNFTRTGDGPMGS
jgi:hypothetical protein